MKDGCNSYLLAIKKYLFNIKQKPHQGNIVYMFLSKTFLNQVLLGTQKGFSSSANCIVLKLKEKNTFIKKPFHPVLIFSCKKGIAMQDVTYMNKNKGQHFSRFYDVQLLPLYILPTSKI